MNGAKASAPPRTVAAGVLVVLVVPVVLALAACGPTGEPESPPPADPRLASLLVDCGGDGARLYDRNTSDFVEVLVEKLRSAPLEVVKRAREELGRLGEESVPALTREVDRNFSTAMYGARVENALASLGLNPAPSARDALLRGLDHPSETIQQTALAGLMVQHARPEDFDRFLAHLASPIVGMARRAFAQALFGADGPRARALAVEWIAEGANQDLWQDFAPRISKTRDEEVARRALAHAGALPTTLEPHLLAPAAAHGASDALERLREALTDASLIRRTAAVEATAAAGLSAEFFGRFDAETNPELRLLMLGHLDERFPEDGPDATEAGRLDELLLAALDDPSPRVRAYSLKLAVRRDVPAAVARATAFLERPAGDLQHAYDAFRARFLAAKEPSEVARVRDALIARFRREAQVPLTERAALLKGVGICPGAESAGFLREVGLAHAGERIEGLDAHAWVMIQAANTGPEGLDHLVGELAGEADPTRRLDLLQALTSSRDERARARLLELTESSATSGVEKLYMAQALVRLGHAAETASRLKRVLYALPDDDPARRPLQCLLWRWF